MPSRPKAPETAPLLRPDGVPVEYEIPGRRPQPEPEITSTSGADAEITVEQETE